MNENARQCVVGFDNVLEFKRDVVLAASATAIRGHDGGARDGRRDLDDCQDHPLGASELWVNTKDAHFVVGYELEDGASSGGGEGERHKHAFFLRLHLFQIFRSKLGFNLGQRPDLGVFRLVPVTVQAHVFCFAHVDHKSQAVFGVGGLEALILHARLFLVVDQEAGAEKTHAPEDFEHDGDHGHMVHWRREFDVARVADAVEHIVFTRPAR